MIRRVTPPRLPDILREAGWRLRRGPFGWQCVAQSGAVIHCWPAAGAAIEEAWWAAEPDHERLEKEKRQWYRIISKLGL